MGKGNIHMLSETTFQDWLLCWILEFFAVFRSSINLLPPADSFIFSAPKLQLAETLSINAKESEEETFVQKY